VVFIAREILIRRPPGAELVSPLHQEFRIRAGGRGQQYRSSWFGNAEVSAIRSAQPDGRAQSRDWLHYEWSLSLVANTHRSVHHFDGHIVRKFEGDCAFVAICHGNDSRTVIGCPSELIRVPHKRAVLPSGILR
jgi:hypothetical protein